MADYIFYRTFDVGQCKIVETFGDKIAGVDGMFIFYTKFALSSWSLTL